MKLLVGLGNPGQKYSKTRHNLGFMIVDVLADELKIEIGKKKFSSFFEKVNINEEEVIVVKPQTFMNLSGEAVRDFAGYFKVDGVNTLVVHDDLDIEFGRMKFTFEAGSGGHNGISSIIDNIGSKAFWRLRIGIGRPPTEQASEDYVLCNFSKAEASKLEEIVNKAASALKIFFKDGPNRAMELYNRKDTEDEGV